MPSRHWFAALMLATSACAHAQQCVDRWDSRFAWREVWGDGRALVSVVHEGREMILVMGEVEWPVNVRGAPDPSGAVLWDGVDLINPLPADYPGVAPQMIWCATPAPESLGGGVFAAGLFPDSYASGGFNGYIARFKNGSWRTLSRLGPGVVDALEIFDDGSGPKLYVGGSFQSIGGNEFLARLVRGDGYQWQPLGPGSVNGRVRALLAAESNGAPALFVGGDFSQVGGLSAGRIATWNGSTWSNHVPGVGGVGGVGGTIHDLEAAEEGGAQVIYAGGDFLTAGGVTARKIARWDGQSWSPVAPYFGTVIRDVEVWPGTGPGAGLYIAGSSGVEKLVNGAWERIAGFGSTIYDLQVMSEPGSGDPILMIAGHRCQNQNMFGGYDGASPVTITNSVEPTYFEGPRGFVRFDDGQGEALYLHGEFSRVGAAYSGGFVRWNGQTWEAPPNWAWGDVSSTTPIELDGRPALAMTGRDLRLDGLWTPLLVWDGESTFAPSGITSSPNLAGRSVVTFTEAGVTSVVFGGRFWGVNSHGIRFVGAWDGAAWRSLDANLNDDAVVNALAVYDAGDGPTLYAAGRKLIDVASIVQWNGSAWVPVPGGPTFRTVRTMLVGDMGDGTRLHVGGDMLLYFPGQNNSSSIITWDGQTWRPFGQAMTGSPGIGLTGVHALEIADINGVRTLFAGGNFSRAGPVPLSCIGRWSEGRWRPLQRGLDGDYVSQEPVRGLGVWHDGVETSLFVAGEFFRVGDDDVEGLARFTFCAPAPSTTRADVNADGVVDVMDIAALLKGMAQGDAAGARTLDLNGDGRIDANDLGVVLGEIGQQP